MTRPRKVTRGYNSRRSQTPKNDNGNSFACATNKDAAKLSLEYGITVKIKFRLYDKHVSYKVSRVLLAAVYEDIKEVSWCRVAFRGAHCLRAANIVIRPDCVIYVNKFAKF